MKVREVISGREVEAKIESVGPYDFKNLTIKRYFFDWKAESKISTLYKLTLSNSEDIKGLIALVDHPEEQRIEIKLLAVSRENVILTKEKLYKAKEFENIAGNLIGYACRVAVTKYGSAACVSLIPKTTLKQHYMREYGMLDAGVSVFLELKSLQDLIKKYKL